MHASSPTLCHISRLSLSYGSDFSSEYLSSPHYFVLAVFKWLSILPDFTDGWFQLVAG